MINYLQTTFLKSFICQNLFFCEVCEHHLPGIVFYWSVTLFKSFSCFKKNNFPNRRNTFSTKRIICFEGVIFKCTSDCSHVIIFTGVVVM